MGGYLERIGTELFHASMRECSGLISRHYLRYLFRNSHASMRADKMTLGAGDASFGKAQIEQSNNK